MRREKQFSVLQRIYRDLLDADGVYIYFRNASSIRNIIIMVQNLSLEQIKEIFNYIDKDNDGKITTKQLYTIVKALGAQMEEADVFELCKPFISPESRAIDFENFHKFLLQKQDDYDAENEMVEAFKLLDKNKDNSLSPSDLVEIATALGENITEEKLSNIIKAIDLDMNEVINYEEFAKFTIENNK